MKHWTAHNTDRRKTQLDAHCAWLCHSSAAKLPALHAGTTAVQQKWLWDRAARCLHAPRAVQALLCSQPPQLGGLRGRSEAVPRGAVAIPCLAPLRCPAHGAVPHGGRHVQAVLHTRRRRPQDAHCWQVCHHGVVAQDQVSAVRGRVGRAAAEARGALARGKSGAVARGN